LSAEAKSAKCVIFSTNKYKVIWDVFVIVMLLFVCVFIPFTIAFHEEEHPEWKTTFLVCDGFFLIDMFLCFFTSITNTDNGLEITDKKKIAKEYLTGWFWIDWISIFPFDAISKLILGDGEGASGNGLVMIRGFKMGKIGKMIRLMRLVKMFKIMKNSSKITA
jgi:hypothetical protein